MKNIINKLVLIFIVAVLTSCASAYTSSKDIKYMEVRFQPLERKDFTLVGNLSVESVITGKIAGKNGKTLDKELRANQKKGLITKSETTEILYFAPGKGQSITGSLYENSIFNSVYTPVAPGISRTGLSRILYNLAQKIRSVVPTPNIADPAIDFAYFEMIQKYPEIDYFINVRFDRRIEVKGKKFTETVLVKADGIVLKTN
jgi:hypothetical protein